MRVRLGGKYWRLRFVPNLNNYGEVEHGDTADTRIIRVRMRQSQYEMMDTLIHEAMHAARPELDEDAVASASSDIARMLWRLGYRRNTCE
jgi:hypothetical protein